MTTPAYDQLCRHSGILITAFGRLLRDPRSDVPPAVRAALQHRLRSVHLHRLPLVLTPEEKARWGPVLLAYLRAYHKRHVAQVEAILHAKEKEA